MNALTPYIVGGMLALVIALEAWRLFKQAGAEDEDQDQRIRNIRK